jgi:hypothetical protein
MTVAKLGSNRSHAGGRRHAWSGFVCAVGELIRDLSSTQAGTTRHNQDVNDVPDTGQ